ncbi:EAL domain-containing protein [Vibrio sp. T187]|uniref:EAL domain-containing protein n=1 Tax=Vibrio TaxID=662 RepID=UPI0010C98F4D|nr:MULTISPECIES: EAL domain-containing protein [Vibrio]MBW3698502.1 EAL domain-containing protein [Vibrio sp. T187]
MKTNVSVRELSISMTITALIFLASSIAISQIFAYQILQRTKIEAEHILGFATQTRDEITTSLSTLNNLKLSECTEQNLLEMRKVLFRSQFIKDIGFFIENDLVCTTGLGMLKVPFKDAVAADIVSDDGIEYWHLQKLLFFNQEHSGLIARKTNYNVVIDPEFITNLLGKEYRWEMYFQGANERYSWAGEQGIADNVTAMDSFNYWGGSTVAVTLCDDGGRLCVAVKPKLLRNSQHPPLLIELTLVVSICLAIFGYLLSRKYYRLQRTTTARVKRALVEQSFYCVYQPIVDLEDGSTVGAEMLARVEDKYGAMTPDEFIPVISKLDKTWQFTEYLMKTAMTEMNELVDAKFKLSMNVYPKDIASSEVEKVTQLTEFKNFRGAVTLEVTESEYLEGEGASYTISQLQSHGIDIAIDDFGTGYSNLNQLRKINSQVLKIDRSFVIDMEDGAIRSSLIQHIVDIARSERMRLVAEGVETAVQHQALKQMGIEYGQGWAFGKPMRIAEFTKYLNQDSTSVLLQDEQYG